MDNIEQLKQLREETGISMIECQKALKEANGDLALAKKLLREKGQEMIKGREGRVASKGLVESYIHANGKIGVLLQLNCESDFVAKSDDFKGLAHELCLQVAAVNPLYVSQSDISDDFLASEREIYQKQFSNSNKPKDILDKIIDGKIKKYKEEVCLLNQKWLKDDKKTIDQLVAEVRAKVGENIEVARFSRYEI